MGMGVGPFRFDRNFTDASCLFGKWRLATEVCLVGIEIVSFQYTVLIAASWRLSSACSRL